MNEELKGHFSVEVFSPFLSGKLLLRIPEIIHIAVPPQGPCVPSLRARVPTVSHSIPSMVFLTQLCNLCSCGLPPSGM